MNPYLQSTLISIITMLLLTPTTTIAQDNNMSFTRSADGENIEWGSCREFMPNSCEIAVLQGDPTNPNADLFLKLQGNTTVSEHWHHSAERMVLVSGRMEVNYEGQSPAIISAGSYAYGPPEKPHSASCLSDEPCILFIAFNEPVDAFPVE